MSVMSEAAHTYTALGQNSGTYPPTSAIATPITPPVATPVAAAAPPTITMIFRFRRRRRFSAILWWHVTCFPRYYAAQVGRMLLRIGAFLQECSNHPALQPAISPHPHSPQRPPPAWLLAFSTVVLGATLPVLMVLWAAVI